MTDLLERMAFMGQVAKNAGISLKEAQKAFKDFGASIRDFAPLTTRIWSEKILDDAKDASLFQREYMQQPNIDYTTNRIEIASTHTNEEDVDPEVIRQAVQQMADRERQMLEREMTEDFPMSLERNVSNTCPHCLKMHPGWQRNPDNATVRCAECGWEFDEFAIENVEFAELRTQVLELELRQTQQQLELENSRHNEARLEPQASRPTMSMDMADRVRYLMSRSGDLTQEEMREFDEILMAIGNVPSVGRSGSFRRAFERVAPRPQPLSGSGVSGDDVLEGNEEALIAPTERHYQENNQHLVETSTGEVYAIGDDGARIRRPDLDRETSFLTKEIYEGLGFGGDPKPKEKIKPAKPLKRKLDI